MRILPVRKDVSTSPIVLLLIVLFAFEDVQCDANAPPPPPPPPAPGKLTAIALPVDVGEWNDFDKVKNSFGTFPEAFAKCGKSQTITLNDKFQQAGKGNIAIQVTCEPGPGYIIQSKDTEELDNLDDKSLLKQCEGLLACSLDDYSEGADSVDKVYDPDTKEQVSYKLPKRPNSVCNKKKLAKKGNIIIANEKNCMDSGKHAALLNKLKGDASDSPWVIYPRWLKIVGDTKQFNLGHRRIVRTPVKAFDQKLVVGFENIVKTDNFKWFECDTTCNKGRMIKLKFNRGKWRAMVYVTDKCPAFRICVSPENYEDPNKLPTCDPQNHWTILVRGGAVVWPDSLGGAAILFSPEKAQKGDVVPIEIGFGVDVGGVVQPELFVGNVYREYVMTDSKGFKKIEHIVMHFPSDNCLVQNAGVVSQQILSGSTYMAASTNDVEKGIANGAGEIVNVTDGQHVPLKPTVPPVIEGVAITTTVPPPSGVPSNGISARFTLDAAAQSDTKDTGHYIEGRWWVWGFYLGMLIGTVAITLPGSALFYVLRRTMFASWYRGMYKRYGCDASGTTGGITGVGFSDTTTGAITVGGTTGGGTTGGGSTTTGGGGTTAGGDTTGTNTLAL